MRTKNAVNRSTAATATEVHGSGNVNNSSRGLAEGNMSVLMGLPLAAIAGNTVGSIFGDIESNMSVLMELAMSFCDIGVVVGVSSFIRIGVQSERTNQRGRHLPVEE